MSGTVVKILDLLAELTDLVLHIFFLESLFHERGDQQLMFFVETFFGLLELLQFLVKVFNGFDSAAEFIFGLEDLTLEIRVIVFHFAVFFNASINFFTKVFTGH